MRLMTKSLGFWARKIMHVTMNGSIAILALFVPAMAIRPLTVVGFVLVLVFESLRLKTRAKQFVEETVGPMFKKEEALDYSGLFWAAIGALIIAQFASQTAYSSGFAVLALCDASAATVGKLMHRKPFYLGKTIPGSVTCFIAAFAISFGYATAFQLPVSPFVFAGIMAIIVTAIELFSYPFDDNFLILVAAAYGFEIAAAWM